MVSLALLAFAHPLGSPLAQDTPGGEIMAGRYEMGLRLKAVEAAWAEAPVARRREGTPLVSAAVGAFFQGKFPEACLSLDQAAAALDGRALRPEDSAVVRLIPPYAPPGGKTYVVVTWAYPVESRNPVELKVGATQVQVRPGQAARMEIAASSMRPSRDSDEEVGAFVPFTVGARQGGLYLTIVPRLADRVKALEASPRTDVKALAQLIREHMEGRHESDSPLLDSLTLAEKLEAGEIAPAQVAYWPRAAAGSTTVRAAFPAEMEEKPTLVLAIHGAGGSENLFFEGYGRGRAVAESLKRGWAFIAPRASRTCAADAVRWFTEVTGKTPGRLIVMGHSMGAGLALQTGTLKPSQIVLFAPAASRVPDDLSQIPLWIGVGKQELLPLAAAAETLRKQLEGRPGFTFRTFDPCEHLMIVSDGLKDALAWLDEQTPKPGPESRGKDFSPGRTGRQG